MWNVLPAVAQDRRHLCVKIIESIPIRHGSSGDKGIKAYSSLIGWPRFPVTPAYNDGKTNLLFNRLCQKGSFIVKNREFVAKRITRNYQQKISGSPSEVFTLLCPVRESDWLFGWECEVIYSESGFAEEGGIYTSSHEEEHNTIWLILKRDEKTKVIEFARINPDSKVANLVISVEEVDDHNSLVHISYTYTALNESGNRFIKELTDEKFTEAMKFWEDSMNYYLKTGNKLHPKNT